MTKLLHLITRFFGAVIAREPGIADIAHVRDVLTADEMKLWGAMSVADRSHSLIVLDRYMIERRDATRAEAAGVLLHDVGKNASRLGTFMRVVATVAGPRTKRLRTYHDHERIGAEMLRAVASDPTTVAMVEATAPEDIMSALRRADNL